MAAPLGRLLLLLAWGARCGRAGSGVRRWELLERDVIAAGPSGHVVHIALPAPKHATSAAAVRGVECLFGNVSAGAPRSWSIDAARRVVRAECVAPYADPSIWRGVHEPRSELRLALHTARGALLAARTPPALFKHLANFSAPRRGTPVVPDVVHIVHVGGAQPHGYACLSMLTAALVHNPAEMVIHVDVEPAAELPNWRCMRRLGHVQVHPRVRMPPAAAAARRPLRPERMLPQHLSDVLRIQVLLDDGGIYLDADCFVVRPLHELRAYDFTMPYDWSKWTSGKLNNGMMLSRPGAPFARLVYESFAAWDGEGWDTQSCRVPFLLAVEHPSLVHVENYPERRDARGRSIAPRFGIMSGRIEVDPAEIEREITRDGVLALHYSGMGSKLKTVKKQERRRRGDLHVLLEHALTHMAAPPERIRTLARRLAEEAGVDEAQVSRAQADEALRGMAAFLREWLRGHKYRDPRPPRPSVEPRWW